MHHPARASLYAICSNPLLSVNDRTILQCSLFLFTVHSSSTTMPLTSFFSKQQYQFKDLGHFVKYKTPKTSVSLLKVSWV
jgi:hypothetical protein